MSTHISYLAQNKLSSCFLKAQFLFLHSQGLPTKMEEQGRQHAQERVWGFLGFWDKFFYSISWPPTHCIAKLGLEPIVLVSPSHPRNTVSVQVWGSLVFATMLGYFLINLLLFYVYESFGCIYVRALELYKVPRARRDLRVTQNRNYRFFSHHAGARNQAQVLCKRSPMLLTPELSLQPHGLFFKWSN